MEKSNLGWKLIDLMVNMFFFKDNTKEKFDVIVACTGYLLSHPFFEKDFIDYKEGSVPLYLKMFHPIYHDLFFIGMFQPLGCIWPALNNKVSYLH